MPAPKPDMIETPESAFMVAAVQIFLLIGLLFALIYDVQELALFALILLAVGLLAYLWRWASYFKLECRLEPSSNRLFPDEKLRIGLQTVNAKWLPILLKVHLFIPKMIAEDSKGGWIKKELGHLWWQRVTTFWDFIPQKRGVYDLGPPLIRTGDLFGFYSQKVPRTDQMEIVVYPRRIKVHPVAVPKREFFGIPGARSPVEDPVFVFGTRDYQTGRPAQRIHWKASARFNSLQEKLCEPAEQEKVLFILDVETFETDKAGEGFETALEAIAALLMQMDKKGVAAGLVTNAWIIGASTKVVPISRSPRQVAKVLEILAWVDLVQSGQIVKILSLGYHIPWGTSAIYFAHRHTHQTRLAWAWLKKNGIPARFVLANASDSAKIDEHPTGNECLRLEQLLVSN